MTPIELVLLGDPVSHSRSPDMHMAALQALGIPGRYTARRVDEVGMRLAAGEVRQGEIDGANITMPHKELAAHLADELAPDARRAGSANTWTRADGRIVGHTTDVPGIRAVWMKRHLPEGRVLVLGAGGAARAALVALAEFDVYVSARSAAKAEALARPSRIIRWGSGLDGAVVVNCTPLGMRGEVLPGEVLASAWGLFDMAYGVAPTPSVVWAVNEGLATADGIDLLVAQAEVSFGLWTARLPPAGLMERVARGTEISLRPTRE